MKVLWLTPYPVERLTPELELARDLRSHPSSWIVRLSSALAIREEITLHIASQSACIDKTQIIQKDGISFHIVRHNFPFTYRGFPDYFRLDLFSRYVHLRNGLRQVFDKIRPDIVHVHGTEYGYGLAALDWKIPVVVSIQGLMRFVAEMEPSISNRLQVRIETDVIRRARYFGSRTDWATQYVQTLNPSSTVFHMPEAVDSSFFQVKRDPKNPIVLFVGSLMARKGISSLIRSAPLVVSKCPSVLFYIVGSGAISYLGNLKSTAHSLGVGQCFHWLGEKSVEEIVTLHKDAAILVLPTLIDNSPSSVSEAMASGLPVIASNVGGIPSMIEDRATGLLVPPGDPENLATAIIRLLKHPDEASKMGERAKAFAKKNFMPENVATRTVEVYRTILTSEQR